MIAMWHVANDQLDLIHMISLTSFMNATIYFAMGCSLWEGLILGNTFEPPPEAIYIFDGWYWNIKLIGHLIGPWILGWDALIRGPSLPELWASDTFLFINISNLIFPYGHSFTGILLFHNFYRPTMEVPTGFYWQENCLDKNVTGPPKL